jgi:beta-1,4-N-acetylglucosaminyltransferase
MIFVSVGMHHQGFDRLIRAMDILAPSLGEPVVMQIGASSYRPRNARYLRFASSEEVEAVSWRASVLVTQCGVGSILTAIRHGVPLVVVARLKRFAEHVDDHQLEVARVLSESGKVATVYDMESLPEPIAQATVPPAVADNRRNLIAGLRQYLLETAGRSGQEVTPP